MITVTKQSNSVLFEFENNPHYLQQGTMEVPFNSLILVEDESDMITFRKASTNDILFSAMYTEFSSLGETKDEVVGALEGMMFAEGGGGGVDPEDVAEIVESALTDYWTSAQTQSAINQASSGKQDTLVSGTNIKTINNESLLGSGNITISGGGSSALFLDPNSIMMMTDEVWSNISDALFNDTPIFYIEKQDGQYSIMKPMEGQIDVSGNELYLTYFSYNNNNQVTITKIGSENYQTDFSRLNIQKELTAGSGITINDNVISANGGSVTIDPTLSSGSSNAVANSAITNAINAKQDTLVSGTNIKTINNQSLLGSGNINISGGSGSYQYYTEDTENKSANIHIENTVEEEGSTIETNANTNVNNVGIGMTYEKLTDGEPTAHSFLDVNENNISLEVMSNEVTTTLEVNDNGVSINNDRVVTEAAFDYDPITSALTITFLNA